MAVSYVKLVPEDRCLLQDIKKKLCELGADSGEGLTDLELRASPVPVTVSGVATEETLANADLTLSNIFSLINSQNTGHHSLTFISPTLPYTILDNVYCAYSIVTQGSVSIDGVNVPSGFFMNPSCGSNEVLQGKVIADVSSGSVFITLQEKQ